MQIYVFTFAYQFLDIITFKRIYSPSILAEQVGGVLFLGLPIKQIDIRLVNITFV